MSELVEKQLQTDQLTLTVGYDIENLKDPVIARNYRGEVVTDPYGRKIPKHAHGTVNLPRKTASTRLITQAVTELFERIADPALLVRRVTLNACRVVPRVEEAPEMVQLDLFTDPQTLVREAEEWEREYRRQQAVLKLKRKYGKNAVVRGMNLLGGATAMDRNRQIGGHRA